jgi:diguanylate cyclase (GGDEF)-like protein
MDRASNTRSRYGMSRFRALYVRVWAAVRRSACGWAVWSLPRWLRAFVLVVITAYLAWIAVSAAVLRPSVGNVELFAGLLLCGAVTVELTRRASETSYGVGKDAYAVWELPVVILLPPLYALVIPAVRMALIQWRVRQAPMYRRVFSAAAVGLSYGCASAVFRAFLPDGSVPRSYLWSHAALWLVAAAACAMTQWIVNQALVLPAVWATAPGTRIRDTIFGREAAHNDATELCVAVLVTLGLTISALTLIIALPLATLLQRAFRHNQLLHEAQADAKTGLLNATTWERQAEAEVARAVRTRSPLAVAILDLDRFKRINDSYGHLLGDEVLRGIADSLSEVLRDYDLAGRFGGEEFVMLLPQTRAVDALRIAERVRAHISRLPVHADGPAGQERVPVTVSIGVAALDAGTRRELSELLAAADAALYRAKASGRDQVQMISTSRGLSAVRPPDAAMRPPAAFTTDSTGVPEARITGTRGTGGTRELAHTRDTAEAEETLTAQLPGIQLPEGAQVPEGAQLPEEEGNSTTATTSALAV